MNSVDQFYISEFSEDILLVELDQASEYLNNSSFLLSLSAFLRKKLDWVEVVAAEKSLVVKYDYLKIKSLLQRAEIREEEVSIIRGILRQTKWFIDNQEI